MDLNAILQPTPDSPMTDMQAGTPSTPSESTDAPRTPVVEQDKKDPFADNFARLVRRERQLKERESKLSDYEKRLGEYGERDRLAKEDPLAFLERSGLSFDEISRKIIEDPITPERKELLELKQKMAKWEEEKSAHEKKRQEEETTGAFENAKKELQELLDKDPEKYELVRLQNAHDLVFQVIYEYQKAFGKWLNFEEAAGKVESHLESDIGKLLESKKLRSRLAPKTEDKPEDSMGAQNAGVSQGENTPTLSNIGANHSTPRQDGRVSDDELMRRAMAVMKNG